MKSKIGTSFSYRSIKASNEGIVNLLIVAIMAHNEEKGIKKAIESVLNQKIPNGYLLKVLVVANGCSDKTEEIVKRCEEQNPDKVVLLSMKEKGKTKAINKAIEYFDELSRKDFNIAYIIFLDADCTFLGEEVLNNFINRFEQNPQLCAIGANCVPDVLFNKRTDIVGNTYRSIYKMRELLKINYISGMCYGLKYKTLIKIKFPDFQFNEDMYVSCRLDGWFFQDKGIKIVFTTPGSLKNELKRRTRQEVSTQRYHEFYSSLKKKGIMIQLHERSLNEDYRWVGVTLSHAMKMLLSLNGIRTKLYIIVYVLTRIWAKVGAYFIMKRLNRNKEFDFWKVIR